MDMTMKQMQELLGRRQIVVENTLTIQVDVVDAKVAFGEVRVLVRPVDGKGEMWVSVGRVQNANQTANDDKPEVVIVGKGAPVPPGWWIKRGDWFPYGPFPSKPDADRKLKELQGQS